MGHIIILKKSSGYFQSLHICISRDHGQTINKIYSDTSDWAAGDDSACSIYCAIICLCKHQNNIWSSPSKLSFLLYRVSAKNVILRLWRFITKSHFLTNLQKEWFFVDTLYLRVQWSMIWIVSQRKEAVIISGTIFNIWFNCPVSTAILMMKQLSE